MGIFRQSKVDAISNAHDAVQEARRASDTKAERAARTARDAAIANANDEECQAARTKADRQARGFFTTKRLS